MKKIIIVGIILFIIGGLIGFGADRVYLKKKSAANNQQANQENIGNTQNAESQGSADMGIDDTGERGTKKQEPDKNLNNMPGAAAGVSLTGKISAGLPAGQVGAGRNAVSVEDQKPGYNVIVESLTFAATGWVVIHDDNNGKPGHILGAHRFNAGSYAGQNVELLQGTEEGKVYYAMLHADDGDRQFDYRVDLPLKDETGNMVMMRFVATSKAVQ